MRKYVILLASLLIMLTLGGIYAWTEFDKRLRDAHGLVVWQTQLIYGLNCGFFTVAMILGGKLAERLGPRLVSLLGGLLFAAGWLTAGFSGGRFTLLFLGVAVLYAAGIALGYVTLLSTCVKWFPRHKGLVTGLTMSGFGAGAIVLSHVARLFFEGGMDVLSFFRWLGVIGGTVVVASSLVLADPPGSVPAAPSRLTKLKSLLRQRRYWALVAGLMAGTFGGQLVAGNLKNIGFSQGIDAGWAALLVTAFAIGSGTGRITWGWLHDRLGRGVVPTSLLLLGAAIMLLWLAGPSGPFFCAAAAFVGFCYGANFVVYAAEVAHHFGVGNVATVYPWVFVLYAISGTAGPPVGGSLYHFTGGYGQALWLAAAVAVLGAAIHWRLRDKWGQEPSSAGCRADGHSRTPSHCEEGS